MNILNSLINDALLDVINEGAFHFNDGRETYLTLQEWQINNTAYYDEFKMRIARNDFTLIEEIFSMGQECLPDDIRNVVDGVAPKSTSSDEPKRISRFWIKIFRNAVQNLDYGKIFASLSQNGKMMMLAYAKESSDGTDKGAQKVIRKTIFFSHTLYNMCFTYVKEFLLKLSKKVYDKDPLLYSGMYFVKFDNGVTQFVTYLTNLIEGNISPIDNQMAVVAVEGMVNASIDAGFTKKRSKSFKSMMSEIRKKLIFSPSFREGHQGKTTKYLPIEKIVPNHTDEVKHIIKEYFSKPDAEGIDIAYLALALKSCKLIDGEVSYTDIHYAVCHLMQHKYNHDKAQKAYGEMRNLDFHQDDEKRGHRYKHAEKVTKWFKERFSKLG